MSHSDNVRSSNLDDVRKLVTSAPYSDEHAPKYREKVDPVIGLLELADGEIQGARKDMGIW
jgi:hypothetical protein